MSNHGTRLVQGVRELIRTDGTTLEDLHMVATDVVLAIDKLSAKHLKKLRPGQKIRVYDEEANKDYGQKGSDLTCFFSEARDLKTRGLTLRVYDSKSEWSVSVDSLLEIYEDFDPDSSEGKKRADKAKPKKRGRKPKTAKPAEQVDRFDNFENDWSQNAEFEEELDGEEYDFNNTEEWQEFFPDDD